VEKGEILELGGLGYRRLFNNTEEEEAQKNKKNGKGKKIWRSITWKKGG